MKAKTALLFSFEPAQAIPWPEGPRPVSSDEPASYPTVEGRVASACHLRERFVFSDPREGGKSTRLRAEFMPFSGNTLKASVGAQELREVFESRQFNAVRFPDAGERWYSLETTFPMEMDS